MIDWQPLGTEPKDGTFFLIAGKWLDVQPDAWCITIADYRTINSLSEDRECWISKRKLKDMTECGWTHWAPIATPDGARHI